MDARTLAEQLNEQSGWASILRGMFRGGRAKKSHEIYTSAQRRGVYETHELRFVTHDSTGYAVMAFSVDGPLSMRTRETLAAQAERFPLGTIRYESFDYGNLTPWGWHPKSYDPTDHTIDALAEQFPGVVVFVALTSTKGSDRPLAVHAQKDGNHYIFPVPGKRLR